MKWNVTLKQVKYNMTTHNTYLSPTTILEVLTLILRLLALLESSIPTGLPLFGLTNHAFLR